MRAYAPVSRADARVLTHDRVLPGPLPAWVVDPQWRAGAPQVDEEEWEYEAAGLAGAAAPPDGLILAVDVEQVSAISDGATQLPEGITAKQLAAVLEPDLAWYAVQELPGLLAE